MGGVHPTPQLLGRQFDDLHALFALQAHDEIFFIGAAFGPLKGNGFVHDRCDQGLFLGGKALPEAFGNQHQMRGVKMTAEGQIAGDFRKTPEPAQVEVHVNAVDGLLLQGRVDLAPGHGRGAHAQGAQNGNMRLGRRGTDLQALVVRQGAHGPDAEDLTKAQFHVAQAQAAVLFQPGGQFFADGAVQNQVRRLVVGDQVGHVEEHQAWVEDRKIAGGFGADLQNAHLQALDDGFRIAEFAGADEFHLECAVGAGLQLFFEQGEGLALRMLGKVGEGDLDDLGPGLGRRAERAQRQTQRQTQQQAAADEARKQAAEQAGNPFHVHLL